MKSDQDKQEEGRAGNYQDLQRSSPAVFCIYWLYSFVEIPKIPRQNEKVFIIQYLNADLPVVITQIGTPFISPCMQLRICSLGFLFQKKYIPSRSQRMEQETRRRALSPTRWIRRKDGKDLVAPSKEAGELRKAKYYNNRGDGERGFTVSLPVTTLPWTYQPPRKPLSLPSTPPSSLPQHNLPTSDPCRRFPFDEDETMQVLATLTSWLGGDEVASDISTASIPLSDLTDGESTLASEESLSRTSSAEDELVVNLLDAGLPKVSSESSVLRPAEEKKKKKVAKKKMSKSLSSRGVSQKGEGKRTRSKSCPGSDGGKRKQKDSIKRSPRKKRDPPTPSTTKQKGKKAERKGEPEGETKKAPRRHKRSKSIKEEKGKQVYKKNHPFSDEDLEESKKRKKKKRTETKACFGGSSASTSNLASVLTSPKIDRLRLQFSGRGGAKKDAVVSLALLSPEKDRQLDTPLCMDLQGEFKKLKGIP